jgi:BirA family biotin operon repressor/biotin-[acetyl-CoA-carboxylase] ligase
MALAVRNRLPSWADVQWLEATESTNTDLLSQARAQQDLPRLRGTHLQRQGRGRANRNFRTEPGAALMFSCAFQVDLPVSALPTLSVMLGLVACETLALRLPPGHRLRLKWPNDLQWGDAKLAGILMESATSGTGLPCRLVIGMGLNLTHADELSRELGRPVADWRATGNQEPPAELCASVASAWRAQLAWAESHWRPGLGLSDLPERYAVHDVLAGCPVQVQDQGVVLMRGVAAGVAPDGRLQLRTDTGIQPVTAGDVSIRPSSLLPDTP